MKKKKRIALAALAALVTLGSLLVIEETTRENSYVIIDFYSDENIFRDYYYQKNPSRYYNSLSDEYYLNGRGPHTYDVIYADQFKDSSYIYIEDRMYAIDGDYVINFSGYGSRYKFKKGPGIITRTISELNENINKLVRKK
jgi:hypothetical protein